MIFELIQTNILFCCRQIPVSFSFNDLCWFAVFKKNRLGNIQFTAIIFIFRLTSYFFKQPVKVMKLKQKMIAFGIIS